ncbi:nucleotidyl transferase AbiEii/AbiGii toxin family protein [Thalassospira xiamenensis]|uniref:Nucleotidyl transferase AbiEii toxin, Type IV TA system n=1 Tax=Thalassospira xiamenensis TaxID=220697 RepID=A0A285TXL0_9PROT|nr:nucleotidyl transferase AbiEii/AbiGii toxin family protein [Thalassospira xiamenensis]SOC30350.1 hypothetical protein SAMN05428964_10915 [Thalassospira xiamenensis]
MTQFPIHDGPHNDDWKSLLPTAIAVIKAVEEKTGRSFDFTIGGGSMLLRRYGHRKSRDLDLFSEDIGLVRQCSPRFNDTAEELCPDYSEEATAVKLIVGMQEIDFITSTAVVQKDAFENVNLMGHDVVIERPREILAKKIAYRGSNFQPRDVFDLAAVLVAEPEEVAAIGPWLSYNQVTTVQKRLLEIQPTLQDELNQKVEAFPAFRGVEKDCLKLVTGLMNEWENAFRPKVDIPPYSEETHFLVYSRTGDSVMVKNLETKKIDNPFGPALISPEGERYFRNGETISEQEWRQTVKPNSSPRSDI